MSRPELSALKLICATYTGAIRTTMAVLDGRAVPDDKSVHEARKHLKRARAALRLLRPALAEKAYELQERRLADAAGELADIRDAKVACDALEELTGKGRPSTAVAALRKRLTEQRKRIRATISRRRLATLHGYLAEVLSAFARNPPRAMEAAELVDELRRTYRKARRALKAAKRNPTGVLLHEWRKKTKRLGYQLEAVQLMPRSRHRLEDAAQLMGTDHDLWMLLAQIPPPKIDELSELIEGIEERRLELQRQALHLGRTAYRCRAREFGRRLAARLHD